MATIEIQNPAETVAYEIDCPRCYTIMTLCFDPESDTPVYTCDACDFILNHLSDEE